MGRLSRENMVVQPFHERKVVSKPPEQRHGQMRMRIDQARQQRGPRQLDEPGMGGDWRLGTWSHGQNALAVDDEDAVWQRLCASPINQAARQRQERLEPLSVVATRR